MGDNGAFQSLRDIELFVAVAETASFTRAAARLGMPVSTLSRRLTELEASLGLSLLVRSTRRVALTEAGAQYFARCAAIVEAAREAREQVQGLAATPSGLLRISLEADVGAIFVAPVIAAFAAAYPAVRLDLDLSPRRVDLLAEGFDLAIRIGTLPDSGLTVRQLAALKVGLFASPTYLAAHGTPATPDDLPRHARLHLLHQADDGAWDLTDPNGRRTHVAAASMIATNNMSMIRSLARLGLGIAVMDEVMAEEDVAAGALRRVLPGWHLPPVPVSALTPARLLPAKTRAFLEVLTSRMRNR